MQSIKLAQTVLTSILMTLLARSIEAFHFDEHFNHFIKMETGAINTSVFNLQCFNRFDWSINRFLSSDFFFCAGNHKVFSLTHKKSTNIVLLFKYCKCMFPNSSNRCSKNTNRLIRLFFFLSKYKTTNGEVRMRLKQIFPIEGASIQCVARLMLQALQWSFNLKLLQTIQTIFQYNFTILFLLKIDFRLEFNFWTMVFFHLQKKKVHTKMRQYF